MNKNLFVGVSVAAVLIVLLLILSGNKPHIGDGNNEITGSENQGNARSQETGIVTEGKTLKDLMSGDLDENVRCEFSHVVSDDNRLDGVTYISGKKVRVDYKLAVPEQGQKDLHMISDGEYGYVWGDSFLGDVMQGSKFKLDDTAATDSAEADETTPSGDYLDYETPVTKCEVWNPDMALFEIPGDITFMTAEELQDSVMQSVGTQNCAMCDSLPVEQKASCRQSLNCDEE
jgi:hypothetical protein